MPHGARHHQLDRFLDQAGLARLSFHIKRSTTQEVDMMAQGGLAGDIGYPIGTCSKRSRAELSTMPFGIGVTDAITFAGAALGMILVVLLATLVPALRATRVSPMVALRCE